MSKNYLYEFVRYYLSRGDMLDLAYDCVGEIKFNEIMSRPVELVHINRSIYSVVENYCKSKSGKGIVYSFLKEREITQEDFDNWYEEKIEREYEMEYERMMSNDNTDEIVMSQWRSGKL